MPNFKNCEVTKGTSNLRFKRCVSQISISSIDSYATLINANGAKVTSVEYIDSLGNNRVAFLNSSPIPVVGTSNFLLSVTTILGNLSFSLIYGNTFENQNAEIRFSKLNFDVYTGIGNGTVPIQISFTESSCTVFDISQMDVSPLDQYLVFDVIYNGQTILSDLQNALQYIVADSAGTLTFLRNKFYIQSSAQNNSPLIDPSDPSVSVIEGTGGLKSLTLLGITTGSDVLNLTELYVGNEVFYTIPSANITFEIEVDCTDLKKVKLKDTTGIYDVNGNPKGYGGPMYPNIANIIGTSINLYDGSNNLLGTAADLGYIPSFSPDTFTFLQSSEVGITSFRRNKEYRIEYIVKVNDGNTISCGQSIFIIDQCGGAVDPYEQLEDCIINRLKSLFEKECSGDCDGTDFSEIDRLIKLKTKFEVIKSSLAQDSACVTDLDIDKLLEECKTGCAGC